MIRPLRNGSPHNKETNFGNSIQLLSQNYLSSQTRLSFSPDSDFMEITMALIRPHEGMKTMGLPWSSPEAGLKPATTAVPIFMGMTGLFETVSCNPRGVVT